MIDYNTFDFEGFPPSVLGKLNFQHRAPDQPALPPGRHTLGFSEERDINLYVPAGIDPTRPTPLLVLFHGGAGGTTDRVLPFFKPHADLHRFLILSPQSISRSWDIVEGGHGPDLERLDRALDFVAARYLLDPEHLAFGGFSDGGSYTLATGLTNGNLVSHLLVFSAGFMNVFAPEGAPRIFMAHGMQDEQLDINTSARIHAKKLEEAGYDLRYIEFNGPHLIQPPIVNLAIHFFLNSPPRRP